MATNQSSPPGSRLGDSRSGPAGESVLGGPLAGSRLVSRAASGRCERAIHEAVVRLLAETRTEEERRWGPRVPYVRPARLRFEQPGADEPAKAPALLVATTDISFEGAGVVSWQEIPVKRLILELSGISFDCQVRWFSAMGAGEGRIYRYGLHFLSLLGGAFPADA